MKLDEDQRQQASQVGTLSVRPLTIGGQYDVTEIDKYIVIYKPGQVPDKDRIRPLSEEVSVQETNEQGDFEVLKAEGGITAETVKALAADPAVRYIEPDYVVHVLQDDSTDGATNDDDGSAAALAATPTLNDPQFPQLWGMRNIHAPRAWTTVHSSPVVVAVVDTGVDYTHEDLAANMWQNPLDPIDGRDNDGNGLVDDHYGADFANDDGDPMDDHHHGTHCAGTIGAVGNNGKGVGGVNWQVKIMALKFMTASGGGNLSSAIKCIDYARTHGAKIISNSWGGGSGSQALQEAVERANQAGILFVVAAGNSSRNNDTTGFYPANYPQENVLSVLSIDENNQKSSFSHYGKRNVDIGAPGRNILSTVPGSGHYEQLNGTSMATPHVAGGAALILGHPNYRGLSGVELKNLLMSRARKEPALADYCVSGGTLDIGFLYEPASTPAPQPPPTPPPPVVARPSPPIFEPPTPSPPPPAVARPAPNPPVESATPAATLEAYNQFRAVAIKKNQVISAVSFELPKTMYVHFHAQTTATLESAAKVEVASGLLLADVPQPSRMLVYSMHRTQFDERGDVQPMSSSFARRLGPGRYTVFWNVWPGNARLVTDAGNITVKVYDRDVGGILAVQEDLEIAEMTRDRQVRTFKAGSQN